MRVCLPRYAYGLPCPDQLGQLSLTEDVDEALQA